MSNVIPFIDAKTRAVRADAVKRVGEAGIFKTKPPSNQELLDSFVAANLGEPEAQTARRVVQLINRMDAAGADAMGLGCQYFAAELIRAVEREFKT